MTALHNDCIIFGYNRCVISKLLDSQRSHISENFMFKGVKAEIFQPDCSVSEKSGVLSSRNWSECQDSTTVVGSGWLVLWFHRSVDIPPRTRPLVCHMSLSSGMVVLLTFEWVDGSSQRPGVVVRGTLVLPFALARSCSFVSRFRTRKGPGSSKVSVYIPLFNCGQTAIDNSEEILTWHLGL